MIDLAIIGGGPAGTAAALEARRRGLSLALFEQGRFPRDKVCGEFLSPEALPLLAREIPSALAGAVPIRQAEFISRQGRVRRFTLPEAAAGLSRRRMDHALWRAAIRAGADAREGVSIRKVSRSGRGAWQVESAPGEVMEARRLLLACGRWWTLDGLLPPAAGRGRFRAAPHRAGPWVGAKAHFHGLAARDAVEMYFFPGGYCGLAPVEDGLYNVCCLAHRELIRQGRGASLSDFAGWIARLARHPALEARLRNGVQAWRAVTTAPISLRRGQPDCQGALVAGDAAGFLDPITGAGISLALHSGRLAAEALAGAALEEAEAVRRYRRALGRSSARSYRLAKLIRLLVLLPAELQELVSGVIPRLGPRLTAETRWRQEA